MVRTSVRSSSFSQLLCLSACRLLVLVILVGIVSGIAQAQKFSVLYQFKGSPDGANPKAGMVTDSAGNFYGTTAFGGKSGIFGTVFKLNKNHKESVLYSFQGADGAFPVASVIVDAKGNLYGTTTAGGGAQAIGVVFKLTKTGKETTLHAFTGQNDGATPSAGLIRDAKGNLYGTTMAGGFFGGGVVFKLTPAGKLIVLYSFCSLQNCSDGKGSVASLIMDSKGNLYGTTLGGGSTICSGGCGVVFKLTPARKETVLYTFCSAQNCTDGAGPAAGLIRDSAGNLYGTTSAGGDPNCNCGTVFKLNRTGHEKVLHSFTGSPDGSLPEGGLATDSKGNFWGTTVVGGTSNDGTVFKVTPSGKETVVHSFNGGDGAGIYGDLVFDLNGNIYGTANSGGSFGVGTIFKLTP